MKKHISFTPLILSLVMVLISGCGGSADPKESHSRGDMVDSVLLSTASLAETNAVYDYLNRLGLMDSVAKYDVNNYKISYITVGVEGDLITASGLLSIPVKPSGSLSPIISYQHGTIFLNSDAPSNSHQASAEPVLAASLGYVVSSPDYIGFGESRNINHPYGHSQTLASSSIDMLRAVKLFMHENAVPSNEQLFLMGYSQGGKATLAMQREIEINLVDEFQITASSPAAGNYDMTSTTAHVLNSPELTFPAYVAWVIKSFNDIYNINRLSDIIEPKYLEAVQSSFNGLKSGSDINLLLPIKTSELIKQSFIDEYLGGGALELKAAIANNNIYDWASNVPTHFFHGVDDRIVPYFNSSRAYDTMVAQGASSVQLVNCDVGMHPANHSNCYYPYFSYAYSFFSVYAENL